MLIFFSLLTAVNFAMVDAGEMFRGTHGPPREVTVSLDARCDTDDVEIKYRIRHALTDVFETVSINNVFLSRIEIEKLNTRVKGRKIKSVTWLDCPFLKDDGHPFQFYIDMEDLNYRKLKSGGQISITRSGIVK